MLWDSYLLLEIKEFGSYEAKIEESEKSIHRGLWGLVVVRLSWLIGRALAAQVRGVLGSTPGDCQLFHFPLFSPWHPNSFMTNMLAVCVSPNLQKWVKTPLLANYSYLFCPAAQIFSSFYCLLFLFLCFFPLLFLSPPSSLLALSHFLLLCPFTDADVVINCTKEDYDGFEHYVAKDWSKDQALELTAGDVITDVKLVCSSQWTTTTIQRAIRWSRDKVALCSRMLWRTHNSGIWIETTVCRGTTVSGLFLLIVYCASCKIFHPWIDHPWISF